MSAIGLIARHEGRRLVVQPFAWLLAALVVALRNNTIAGAALDVFENEPLMAAGLAECRNAILVPHIASGSQDTRDRMAMMAATNAVAHLIGERAPNVVNPEVYETPAYAARRSAASA